MAVAEAFIEAGLKIPWGAFFAPMAPPKGYFELMAGRVSPMLNSARNPCATGA
jgi:hypothetical protein